MITTTRSLLTTVLDAHGGAERWRSFDRVTANVASGGFLWAMKGIALDSAPRRMTSDFKRQRMRTEPFGSPEWHMTYQPDQVAIETVAGEIVAEQARPRETFDGHAWETPWTPRRGAADSISVSGGSRQLQELEHGSPVPPGAHRLQP